MLKYFVFMKNFGLRYLLIMAALGVVVSFIFSLFIYGADIRQVKEQMMAMEIGFMFTAFIWVHIHFTRWLKSIKEKPEE